MTISLSELFRMAQKAIADATNFITQNTIENWTKTYITKQIKNTNSIVYKRMKSKLFRNLPPKIGYFNETKPDMASEFNISLSSGFNDFYSISDCTGCQILYFSSRSNPTNPLKLYSGYRVNTKFIYHNTPVIPAYMSNSSKNYLIRVLALGSDFMIAQAYYNGSTQWHLIHTNYSSDPINWTTYVDITSIINNASMNIFNILYNTKLNRLVLLGLSNQVLLADLYDVNTKTKITRKEIEKNIWTNICNNVSGCFLQREEDGQTAIYDKHNSRLIFIKNVKFGINQNYYGKYTAKFVYSISETNLFNNLSGMSSNLIPNSQYKPFNNTLQGVYPYKGPGLYQVLNSTYDDIQNKIFYIQKSGSLNMDANLYYDNTSNNISIDNYFSYSNVIYNVQTNDVVPWGKCFSSGMTAYIFNDYLYMGCISKKYGGKMCYVDYKYNVSKNENEFLAKSWHFIDNFPTIDWERCWLVCHKNGSSVTWYDCQNAVYELSIGSKVDINDGLTKDGFINRINRNIPMYKNIPSGLEVLGAFYHPNKKLWFCFVRDWNHEISSKHDIFYIASYNPSSNMWTKHKNIPQQLLTDYDNAFKENNSDITLCFMSHNFFIDSDDSFYLYAFTGHWELETYNRIWHCTYNNGTLSYDVFSRVGLYAGDYCSFGWSPRYHYYMSQVGGTGNQFCWIYQTRDPKLSSLDKTTSFKTFLTDSNARYTNEFKCSSAIGLTVILQDTPIFIGGYFGILTSRQIVMNPNATNYIYFYRPQNKAEDTDIQVEVTTTPKSSNDVDGFYRLYIGSVKTDSNSILNVTFNEIKNYSNKLD